MAVTIYFKAWCPYSRRALALLATKPVDFEAIDVDEEDEREEEMIRRAGGRQTVPQIFIGERHVGGCDELVAADRRGELDSWLSADTSV
jgi:glutaredoxin 3